MYRKPSQLQAEVADVAWRARELELAEADAVGSGGGMPASSAWAGPPDAAAAAAPLGRTHMLATGGLGMQPPPDTPVNDAALEAAALMQRLVVASNRQAMVLLANEDLAGSEAWLCKAQQALYRARVTGAARFMPAGEESEGGLHVLTYNNIACFQRRAGNLNAALQCLRDAVLEGERGGATDQQLAVTHSNLCAILSEIGKHPLAMTYARAAVLHCKRALKLQVPKPAGTAASAANAMTAEQKREKARLRAERGIQKAAGEEPAEEEGGPSDHMKAAASQAEQRVQQHKTIMALAVACHNLAVEVEFVEGKPCLHWYAKAAALAERAAMLSAAEAGSGKDADMVASSMALAKKLVESNKSATAKWKRKSLVVVRTSGNTARSLRKPGTAGGRKGRGRSRKSRSGSGGSRDAHYSTSLGGGGGNDGADGNRDDGEGERPEWNDDPIVAHELRPAALDNDLDLLDETEKAALFGKAKRTDYYADSPVVSSGYGQPPSPDKKGRSGDDADAGDAEDEGREDAWASSKRGDGKRSKYSAEELRRFDFELSELDLGLGIALDPHQPELVGVKKRPKSRPRTGTGGRPLPGKKTRRQGDKRSKSPGKGGKANGKAGTLEMDEAVAKKIQSKLKAACYGTTPQVLFSRWDKDGGGTLDHAEFKKMVRVGLKIPPSDLADQLIKALIKALDDDNNGELSIAELADFVERGTATFYAGPEAEDVVWGDNGVVANDGDDGRAAAEAGARAGMEVEAVPHTPYASGRGGEGTDVGADVGADIGHTPYTNAEALIDKAELELVYERAKANVLGGRTPGSPARPEPGGFMYGVGAVANASMGADADAGIDRDELERVYERAKTHVLASMDSPSRADTLANGGGGAGVALPSPIDVGLRQHMGGTEYDISGQRIDAVEEGGDGHAHTFPEFMRFHNDDHDAALRQWVGSKVLQYAQDVGGAVAAAATVPESPMARSHLSAATGSSAGDNAYMNQAAGLLAAAREQAQRLTPGGASRSQSAMLSPDARARSVSSGEEHVFGTADESPDRAAKVLTILDSAEREARRKSLAAAQMAEDLAQMAAVAEAEAAVDAAERTADEAVATTAATTATERAAQEAEDMLAMLDASEEEEAARVNAEVAAKEAARNVARSASGMRSAGKSPSTGGPARHNLGVGEQRSQRSEDLVWEQVQEQERTVKDRAQQDLHPELGESPYHQKLTGAPGASYARATAADDDAAAAGGEGGDGGRGKRRGKPKSPKYFSHASQRAGNVPTPQEEYVARKRLDKIEKGIEQMMSDESRRHPPTWKIKHQKDVEKQELDRALAEALGVIEQKEKALGIGQRLNYGISAGGAAGGGGGRKVPRSLKGMSLTATANFKSAIGAV
mmetsp:Transcript_103574/g.297619  ORF Transcript_103574/g.297619 Transcript_103574/m.297619 type:complete len:1370 (+) Transcript_103574:118-4227(+)